MRRTVAGLGAVLAFAVPLSGTAHGGVSARVARADDGTRFALRGARVRVTASTGLKLRRGARVEVRCGRKGAGERRIGRAVGRLYGRHIVARLRPRPGRGAEWCQLRRVDGSEFSELSAVRLPRPALAPPPALVDGPDVRTALSNGQAKLDGARDATFRQRGSVLTVEYRQPLHSDGIVFAACFRRTERGSRRVGFRLVAVRPSQRTVTVDLERDASRTTTCLLEDDSGTDLFVARF